MPRRTRLASLGLLVALGVPVLGACSSRPGAAAIVGSTSIPSARLQADVTAALVDPTANSKLGGAKRPEFTREMLAHLITDDVVAAAARDHHVTVSAKDISDQTAALAQQAGSQAALQQQAAAGGVPASQLADYIRGYALQQKLSDALVAGAPVSQAQLQQAYQQNADSYDQVHAAHILVKSHALGRRLLAEVRAQPSRFAALAKRYSIDTGSKANGGDLGFAGRSKYVKPFGDALFTNKPGSYVLVHSQFGWHVIHVIARRTQTLAQATPALKSTLLTNQRQALLAQALVSESQKLGVHVNPRYGTWDARNQAVVPTKDTVTAG